MATKNKQTAAGEQSSNQTWRKPLQVPPRTNSMHSFYKGAESGTDAGANQAAEREIQPTTQAAPQAQDENKTEAKPLEKSTPKNEDREAMQTKPRSKSTAHNQNSDSFSGSSVAATAVSSSVDKLTKEDLSEHLGLEIEDLFDVYELLRGKSFDIYQQLRKSADANGRSKITQPELMKRTGIKNRRTFYKHEEWLIKLKLLEKRHLPGDHKGVVYRLLELSDVLPFSDEMLEKFERGIENTD